MSNWTKGVLLIAGILTALLAVTVSLVDADDRMSLWGAGVIAIVLLVIPLIAMRFALRHWKVVGVTLIVCLGVAWGWSTYDSRPYRVEELAGVRLGMTPVEVTLALGEPENKGDVRFREDIEEWEQRWNYFRLELHFSGEEASDLTLGFIDSGVSGVSVFGLGRDYLGLGLGASSELDVFDRLGPPDTESINQAGTQKIIFYNEWQTGFRFQRDELMRIVVSSRGARFPTEYGDDPEAPDSASLNGSSEPNNGQQISSSPQPLEQTLPDDRIFRLDDASVTPPRVLREVKPQYTSWARYARVQGNVLLDVEVLPNGTVGDVTVSRSLDRLFGLDTQAVYAAQQWIFSPCTRAGTPVRCLVTVELFFHLQSSSRP